MTARILKSIKDLSLFFSPFVKFSNLEISYHFFFSQTSFLKHHIPVLCPFAEVFDSKFCLSLEIILLFDWYSWPIFCQVLLCFC